MVSSLIGVDLVNQRASFHVVSIKAKVKFKIYIQQIMLLDGREIKLVPV